MRSMTGFGAGEAPLGHGRLVVEVRTVNHRFLDVRVRLPKELADCAMMVEQLTRGRLSRGRCEISVRLDGAAHAGAILDRARARAAFAALAEVRDELAPGAELPLTLLATVPDLFVVSSEGEVARMREALTVATHGALDAMDAMRAREGEGLRRDVAKRAHGLRLLVRAIAARVPDVLEGYRRRLRERIRTLMSTEEAPVDEARLEQEVVLFADRTDISEELTRLEIHLDGAAELLDCSEPCGRRLDFLLQEIGREINTIGAKSQDAAIARAVVEAKAELERVREQVQNVE